MSLCRVYVLLCGMALLSGCGFRPLYGDHEGGSVSREFARIEIGSIRDRAGQQFRSRLLYLLQPRGTAGSPAYHLGVSLTESSSSLGVQKTSLATRANLVVTAGISLASLGGGEALYTATDQVSVSYNILNSEFATLMAEKDARNRAINALSENIRIRLGAYFERLETERKGMAP